MPKTTFDDSNRICPHCGHKYQPESADYSEQSRDEQCDECGKTYLAWDSFSVTHCAMVIEPVDTGEKEA
jgi:NADH pyrophosphatase NudC (nudix superfamily)